MALELEQIQPWDGQSGTGAEVRGALNRNFEKLKNLSILAGMPIKDLFTSVDLLPRPGISGNNYLVGENLYVWSESVLDYVDIGSVKGQDGLDGIDGKDSKQVTTVAYDGTRPVLRLLTDGSGVSYTVPTFSKSDGSTTTIITEAATYTNAEALSSKVDKGGSDKTLKQVEDEIVQLAGDSYEGYVVKGSPQSIILSANRTYKAYYDTNSTVQFKPITTRLIFDPGVYVATGSELKITISAGWKVTIWEFGYSTLSTPVIGGLAKSGMIKWNDYLPAGEHRLELRAETRRVFLQLAKTNNADVAETEITSAISKLELTAVEDFKDNTPDAFASTLKHISKINDVLIQDSYFDGVESTIVPIVERIYNGTHSIASGSIYVPNYPNRCIFLIDKVIQSNSEISLTPPLGYKMIVDQWEYCPIDFTPFEITGDKFIKNTDWSTSRINIRMRYNTRRVGLRIAKVGDANITPYEAFNALIQAEIKVVAVEDFSKPDNLKLIAGKTDSTIPIDVTAHYYDGEKVEIRHKIAYRKYMNLAPSQSTFTGQGSANFGDYFFNFFDHLHCVDIYNLKTKQFLDTVLITDPAQNSRYHANSVNFSNEYYSANDEFPILYTCSGYTETTESDVSYLWGFRITKDSNDKFTFQKVHTVTLKFGVNKWTQPVIDNDSNSLWISANSKWYKFTMPLASAGDVTINHDDVNLIDSFSEKWIYNSSRQGHIFHNNRLYNASGVPSWNENLIFSVLNVITKRYETIIDLRKIGMESGANNLWEPEALIIWNGSFFICYRTMIYELFFE